MRAKGVFKRLNVCISLCLVMLLHVGVVTAQNTSPLCFTARNGSVTVRFDIKNVTHTIQYSTDSVNWNTYTSNSDVVLNANQSVYFRAESNQTVATAFGQSSYNNRSRFYFSSSNGGNIEGSGNIMSLYGPDCPNLSLPWYAFMNMFEGCSILITAPDLPATTLAKYCYGNMFYGCSSLANAPLLPAATMKDYCYYNMFNGCSSLTNPPTLPATTLANHCYDGMFTNCTSLTIAPALPVTTLKPACYHMMFYLCQNLVTLPTLPATTLADSCYSGMFYMCRSIITPPILPATTLAPHCYAGMFNGCMSMTTVPELPVTTLAYYCYASMFADCRSIATAPELPAMSLTEGCYNGMFEGCTSLMFPPALPATALASFCYCRMFDGCTNLTNVPALPATYLANHCYWGMFSNCTSLIINTTGTGKQWIISATSWENEPLSGMFSGTSGTMNGTPLMNTYYYIASYLHRVTVNTNDTTFGSVSGEGFYQEGETATLTANANAHCHFVSWSDGNTSAIRSFAVYKDSNLIASFEIDKHTITVNGANGSVTGGGVYDYGTSVNLTATPNNHYYFARWSDGDTVNPRVITVDTNRTYTAVFEGEIQLITVNGTNGTVSGGGSYHYGSTVTLTAAGDTHYHFAGWSDGDMSNPRTIVVNGDLVYTALFEIDKHIVSGSGRNGIISGLGEYDYGSTVTLTAIPDEHYCDVTWSDGDSVLSKSFVITEDVNYTADFAKCQYVVNATCEHGEVTGNGIYENPDIVTLYVETYNGYRFVEWSDGEVYNPRVFVVEEDLEVEAICEAATGAEDVEESVAFYYVRGRVVNPEGVMLRVYSTEGKMVKSCDGDIVTEGLPAGMYMVVDEYGNSLKVVVKP